MAPRDKNCSACGIWFDQQDAAAGNHSCELCELPTGGAWASVAEYACIGVPGSAWGPDDEKWHAVTVEVVGEPRLAVLLVTSSSAMNATYHTLAPDEARALAAGLMEAADCVAQRIRPHDLTPPHPID